MSLESNNAIFREASDLGVLQLTGRDTLDLLNRMSTNTVLNINPFDASHTILTNDKGKIIDIVYIVNLETQYLLITSPNQDQTVLNWLDKYTIMEDIEYSNQTDEYSVFHIIHPDPYLLFSSSTQELDPSFPVAKILNIDFEALLLPYKIGTLDSFLFLTNRANHQSALAFLSTKLTLWDSGQYEQFRISQKIPVYGKELSEEHNPLEAGLIGAIDFHKGCYIGQEVIARLDTYDKVQKHLSFIQIEACNANITEQQLFSQGKLAGIITSSQAQNKSQASVGMAYIHKNYSAIGTTLLTKEGTKVNILENPLFFGEEN